jgi:hypothetical protein
MLISCVPGRRSASIAPPFSIHDRASIAQTFVSSLGQPLLETTEQRPIRPSAPILILTPVVTILGIPRGDCRLGGGITAIAGRTTGAPTIAFENSASAARIMTILRPERGAY